MGRIARQRYDPFPYKDGAFQRQVNENRRTSAAHGANRLVGAAPYGPWSPSQVATCASDRGPAAGRGGRVRRLTTATSGSSVAAATASNRCEASAGCPVTTASR